MFDFQRHCHVISAVNVVVCICHSLLRQVSRCGVHHSVAMRCGVLFIFHCRGYTLLPTLSVEWQSWLVSFRVPAKCNDIWLKKRICRESFPKKCVTTCNSTSFRTVYAGRSVFSCYCFCVLQKWNKVEHTGQRHVPVLVCVTWLVVWGRVVTLWGTVLRVGNPNVMTFGSKTYLQRKFLEKARNNT